MDKEIVVLMGPPASGKSTVVQQYQEYKRFNRDSAGGSLEQLHNALDRELAAGLQKAVLDNTYATKADRKPVIDIGRKHGIPVRCVLMGTSIEDCQVNACMRMIDKYGKVLMTEDAMKNKDDPNLLPPVVLFAYRNKYEKPTTAEGFSRVDPVKFIRQINPAYTKKALFLDYDGTLRHTKSGKKYPSDPDDVVLLPNRTETLSRWKAKGYLLFGISNQGDIGRNKITAEEAKSCFERTHELLGITFKYFFCPHNPMGGIKCWCRKPMPGVGVELIEKHKLDRNETIMVGDQTSDKTFAQRCGIQYIDQGEFFK